MKKLILFATLIFFFNSCSEDKLIQSEDKSMPEKSTSIAVPEEGTANLLAITNFYVNGTTGNDANAGTSTSLALKTIQAALWKTTDGTGATIYVAGGIYKERLWWPNSGSSTEPITLTNYNGEVVTLDGINATNDTQNAMISIQNKSHIRINNINITNNTRQWAGGIDLRGSGTNVQFTYCKISNIGWTTNSSAIPSSSDNASPFIIVGSTSASYNNIYIGNNEIFNCNTGYSEGMTITGNVEIFLIENNIVHDIKNIGIDCSGNYSWSGAPANVNFSRNGNIKGNIVYNCVSPVATSGGIYVDGGKWINIEGNTCYRNYAGINVGCENDNYTVEGINVRSNFVYDNIEAGLLIGSNQPNSKVINSTISNNSLYKNYSKGGWGGEIHLQRCDNVSFINNIINSRSNIVVIASSGYPSTNLKFNYNKYYSLSGSGATVSFDWGGNGGGTYSSLAAFQTATGLDANSNYGIPGFMSASLPTPDLHLSSSSASKNAGLPTFAAQSGELDIDKGARVVNSRVDIGADETSN